jgi:hypothetical protein
MVVITVFQCNSNTLNVIATDMLQLFKMFIVIVIQNIFKIIAITGTVKILISANTLNMLQMRYGNRCN